MCNATGDKVSLAIGMSGLVIEFIYTGRPRGFPAGHRTDGAARVDWRSHLDHGGRRSPAFTVWFDAGEFGEILRWSQRVIDLAAGDPAKGAGFGFGSPLAIALGWRGNARWWLGRPGWREDHHDAVAMARKSDPTTFAVSSPGLQHRDGLRGNRADDATVRVLEEAVRAARSCADIDVSLADYTLGIAPLYRDAPADRDRGLNLMVRFREFMRECAPFLVPVAELWVARERARSGDRDAAIALMRQAVDELHQAGRLGYGVGAPAFWWRRCWSAAPTAIWPKPKRRSTGWQPAGDRVRDAPRSRCCGCGAAGRARGDDAPTGGSVSATATWPCPRLRGSHEVGRGNVVRVEIVVELDDAAEASASVLLRLGGLTVIRPNPRPHCGRRLCRRAMPS